MLNDTIVAAATPAGVGAIAIVRIAGHDAINISSKIFVAVGGKKLKEQKSHTVHLGYIIDGERKLDKVLATIFKSPNSYTGDNIVEISCHGSLYIQQQIIQLLLRKGCRMATPGEFTMRAFLNGKMDLSQAEAVADLISSDSEAAHKIAMDQMRGGFSNEIKKLREELLNFASLMELELDFSQEDVEFADRTQFHNLLNRITEVLKSLIDSFSLGNVLKNGIPVAIVGEPNVGKSTLLNTLLNEDKAIVSDIAGTTRDSIEDQISIEGVNYRFIDTAGIRTTDNQIEKIGIQKTFEKIKKAKLVIYLFDASNYDASEIDKIKKEHPNKQILIVINKIDEITAEEINKIRADNVILLSAKTGEGVEELKSILLSMVQKGALENDNTIISNGRHYAALVNALEEVQKVKAGLSEEIATDLLSIDIRQALFHLGEITGSVSTDDLLGNIFSNFCIGK